MIFHRAIMLHNHCFCYSCFGSSSVHISNIGKVVENRLLVTLLTYNRQYMYCNDFKLVELSIFCLLQIFLVMKLKIPIYKYCTGVVLLEVFVEFRCRTYCWITGHFIVFMEAFHWNKQTDARKQKGKKDGGDKN